jgi:UDP-2,3-diacylglucosamine pyrophosphatase LpxH
MPTAELFSTEVAPYGEKELKISSGGRGIFVISDLHMASGLNINSNYEGTENFFADQSFSRFLNHLQKKQGDKKSILIINGDFIDFLRIVNLPETDSDFSSWQKMLADIGIAKSKEELQKSITAKEKKFGMKTHDYKSVYRLHICAQGHPLVFESLACWLLNGNSIIITKGNHDLEWYWKAVRDYLRLIFAQHISAIQNSDIESILKQNVIPNLTFVDDKLIIDENIYIEHGHRYENFCWPGSPATVGNKGKELSLPFGSFFNRYLINYVELAYPYIDNIRPGGNILPVLIREKFPLAIKILFYYLPFALEIIPKRQYKQAFRHVWHFFLMIFLPVGITVFAIWHTFHVNNLVADIPKSGSGNFILQQIFSVVKNFAFLSLSYFLGRLLIRLQVSAPENLYTNAKKVFDSALKPQLVTFGHTHNPQQEQYKPGQHYYNTGTWMPVYELDAADVRLEKTFTFLHITHDSRGNINPTELQRWNDDASRDEPLVLMDRT